MTERNRRRKKKSELEEGQGVLREGGAEQGQRGWGVKFESGLKDDYSLLKDGQLQGQRVELHVSCSQHGSADGLCRSKSKIFLGVPKNFLNLNTNNNKKKQHTGVRCRKLCNVFQFSPDRSILHRKDFAFIKAGYAASVLFVSLFLIFLNLKVWKWQKKIKLQNNH